MPTVSSTGFCNISTPSGLSTLPKAVGLTHRSGHVEKDIKRWRTVWLTGRMHHRLAPSEDCYKPGHHFQNITHRQSLTCQSDGTEHSDVSAEETSRTASPTALSTNLNEARSKQS